MNEGGVDPQEYIAVGVGCGLSLQEAMISTPKQIMLLLINRRKFFRG
jgi:hypothetical protein